MFKLQFMIQKPQSDLLTLSMTFYNLSVSRNPFSRAKVRQFGQSGIEGLRYSSSNKDVKMKTINVYYNPNLFHFYFWKLKKPPFSCLIFLGLKIVKQMAVGTVFIYSHWFFKGDELSIQKAQTRKSGNSYTKIISIHFTCFNLYDIDFP